MREVALREWVEIQQATVSPNSFGEALETWQKYSKCKAQIMPISGTEAFIAEQEYSELKVRIKIRYDAGVNTAMRVVHNFNNEDIIYDIRAVILENYTKKHYLMLNCLRRNA